MPSRRWLRAFGAHAVSFEAMSRHSEAQFQRDFLKQLCHIFVTEFNQFIALSADEVIVLRIAVVVFINVTVIGPRNFADQSGLFHLRDRAVHSRSADTMTVLRFVKPCDNLFAVEVFVIRKDCADDDLAFLCEPHLSRCQEFTELLDG